MPETTRRPPVTDAEGLEPLILESLLAAGFKPPFAGCLEHRIVERLDRLFVEGHKRLIAERLERRIAEGRARLPSGSVVLGQRA